MKMLKIVYYSEYPDTINDIMHYFEEKLKGHFEGINLFIFDSDDIVKNIADIYKMLYNMPNYLFGEIKTMEIMRVEEVSDVLLCLKECWESQQIDRNQER